MRLGQLARKLALPPSEITAYLASQQIHISDDANARIEENHVAVVLQRFAPALLNVAIGESEEAPAPAEEPVVEAEPVAVEETIASEPAPEVSEETVPSTTDKPEDVELIKAPKVALAGLKVLGKIELPEKKKKPEATADINPETTSETPAEGEQPVVEKPSQPQRERRRPDYQRRDQRDQRPKKNPIALAREREARAAEEKRIEEQKLKKEQRTQNYMKRVQAKAPTKAAKLVNEDLIDMAHVDMRPEPKTWIGKFWRWFRS